MKTIATKGSLTLSHSAGDDFQPERFEVTEFETGFSASLEIACDFGELTDRRGRQKRINGSQVQTVRLWVSEFL